MDFISEYDLSDRCFDEVSTWVNQNKSRLLEEISSHGAVLLKNAGVNDSESFERLVGHFSDDLYHKNGEHVRYNKTGTVQTPVPYSNKEKLKWHNENSFHYRWPSKIFFSCVKACTKGGETPLVNMRELYKRLPRIIRAQFERKGVSYVRCYVPDLGLSYKETLNVKSKDEANDFCLKNHMNYEWLGDVLKTTSHRPAVIKHPVLNEKCFVAQILHWHHRCLADGVRKCLLECYGEDAMPRSVLYGNGEKIEDSVIDEIIGIHSEIEIARPWSEGDFIVIDNIATAHGRNPYEGERKLLVSLADPFHFMTEHCRSDNWI